ncbi:MAG: O-antigen ligase family protein [Vagococcus sp.]
MELGKQYVRSLFLFIVLMILPFIFVSIFNNNSLLLPMMALNFLISVVLLLRKSIMLTNKLNTMGLVLSFVYYFIVSLTLISNMYLNINTDYFDVISTLAKLTTFVLFFTIPLNIKLKVEDISYFYWMILYFSLFSCIYNLVINYSQIINIRLLSNSYDVAFQSFFSNRNQYGAFLFITITVLDMLKKEFKNYKYFYLTYCFIILNLLLTMSRGAILATIIYMCLFFILRDKKKHDWTLFLFITTIIFILSNNKIVNNILITYIVRPDNGSTGRSKLWELGYDIFQNNNIITGIGLQTSVTKAKMLGMERDEFHNFYLEILLSGGLFELIFILSIFVIIIIMTLKNITDDVVRVNIISRLIGFLALGLVESVGLFSIGYVDVFFSIFLITIPILEINLSNNLHKEYI